MVIKFKIYEVMESIIVDAANSDFPEDSTSLLEQGLFAYHFPLRRIDSVKLLLLLLGRQPHRNRSCRFSADHPSVHCFGDGVLRYFWLAVSGSGCCHASASCAHTNTCRHKLFASFAAISQLIDVCVGVFVGCCFCFPSVEVLELRFLAEEKSEKYLQLLTM